LGSSEDGDGVYRLGSYWNCIYFLELPRVSPFSHLPDLSQTYFKIEFFFNMSNIISLCHSSFTILRISLQVINFFY
jgi:hypothetical protein